MGLLNRFVERQPRLVLTLGEQVFGTGSSGMPDGRAAGPHPVSCRTEGRSMALSR